jgi:GAF domain-containing protein
VPLSIGRPGTGTLAFYHRQRHAFSDVEIDTARSLSDLAGAAITTAEVYEAQRRQREAAERANRQAAALAEAGAALADSLDYAATLRTVAHRRCRESPTVCVDIVDDRGEIKLLAVEHVDPTSKPRVRFMSATITMRTARHRRTSSAPALRAGVGRPRRSARRARGRPRPLAGPARLAHLFVYRGAAAAHGRRSARSPSMAESAPLPDADLRLPRTSLRAASL